MWLQFFWAWHGKGFKGGGAIVQYENLKEGGQSSIENLREVVVSLILASVYSTLHILEASMDPTAN